MLLVSRVGNEVVDLELIDHRTSGDGSMAGSTPGVESGKDSALARDNAELRRENDALRRRVNELSAFIRMALRDPLTGLPNRRYFDQRVVEEIARARRHASQLFSLLVIDINDFKQINDTFGHATGDETLKWVGTFLEGNLRLGDVCCRMAGDEFIVILPNTDAERARCLVTRLVQLLDAANHWLEIPVRLAIGQATFGVDGVSVEEMFNSADAAMYRDKQAQKRAPRATSGPRRSRTGRIELIRPTEPTRRVDVDRDA